MRWLAGRGLACGALCVAVVACSPEQETPAPAREAPAQPAASAARARPNILLITLDTTRADALGAYGQPRATTPELDALAARGALFEAAYTASPSTLPSHATILTGRLPFAHGARSNTGYVLSPQNRTLAEVFAEAGYVTGAEIATAVIGRRSGVDQGFAHFRDVDAFDVEHKRLRAGGETISLKERDAADITRHAIAFLDEHRDEPFFLWLHYFDPHQYYAAPAEWQRRLPGDAYHAEVLYMDHQVGRVFAELERQGLAADTLVAVTADHGEGLGEHEENSHSFFVYDTTMRIPLIFAWPGKIAAGRRIPGVVRSADIAPTLLELAGLPALMDIQGVSLAASLRGGPAPTLDAYGESLEPHALFGSSALRFLRRGEWKYIHKAPPELYDLAQDPREERNLAEAATEQVEALAEALRGWVERDARHPGDARTQVDEATRRQLQALGYLGATPDAGFEDARDVRAPSGPDPRQKIGDIDRYNAGWAALRGGEPVRAVEIFRELHERNLQSFAIVDVLVNAGIAAEIGAANLPYIRRAIELDPNALEHYGHLAGALADRGDFDDASRALDQAFAIDPCHAGLRALQSKILNTAGRIGAQLSALRASIDACPSTADARNDYAYQLATLRDPALRDGAEALRIAREIVAASPDRPDYLDTLACAHAASGDFAEATRLAERALALVKGRLAPEIVAVYQQHRDSFASGNAIEEP